VVLLSNSFPTNPTEGFGADLTCFIAVNTTEDYLIAFKTASDPEGD
jgi:hypothetical protein